MSYTIKTELPSEAVQETLTALLATITTADPALLVAVTSGNKVTLEEKYAYANAQVPTAGSVAANAAALATFLAAFTALQTAFAGNPLGEGVEGLAIESVVQAALVAVGLPTGVAAYAGAPTPPTGVPNTSASYGTVEVGLADFIGLVIATLELGRARTILLPAFTVNAK